MRPYPAALRTWTRGPYRVRLARVGLHRWLEVIVGHRTLTISLMDDGRR